MRRFVLVAVCLVGLVGSGCVAFADQGCDLVDARSGSLDGSGISTVRVMAGAGSLIVRGVSGSSSIEASGEACASRQGLLDEISLRMASDGDVAVVEAMMPKRMNSGTARLNLVVEVPAGVALEVDDGSGSLEIVGVESLILEDGSGNARVEDVAGDVKITDGSGGLHVQRISGNLWLEDGSGEIEVRGVGGDVIVDEDGSGGMEITGVEGSVHVLDDGSGSIHVTDVTGDLVVEDDGSGGVSYERIGGRVDVEDS